MENDKHQSKKTPLERATEIQEREERRRVERLAAVEESQETNPSSPESTTTDGPARSAIINPNETTDLNFIAAAVDKLSEENLKASKDGAKSLATVMEKATRSFALADIEFKQNKEGIVESLGKDTVAKEMLDELEDIRNLEGSSRKDQKMGLERLQVIREYVEKNTDIPEETKNAMLSYTNKVSEGLEKQSSILSTMKTQASENVDKIGFGVAAAFGNSPFGMMVAAFVTKQAKDFIERRRERKKTLARFKKSYAMEGKQTDALDGIRRTMQIQTGLNAFGLLKGMMPGLPSLDMMSPTMLPGGGGKDDKTNKKNKTKTGPGTFMKVAKFAGQATLVGAAGMAGYEFGKAYVADWANSLINGAVESLTNGKNKSFGGWLYDWIYGPDDKTKTREEMSKKKSAIDSPYYTGDHKEMKTELPNLRSDDAVVPQYGMFRRIPKQTLTSMEPLDLSRPQPAVIAPRPNLSSTTPIPSVPGITKQDQLVEATADHAKVKSERKLEVTKNFTFDVTQLERDARQTSTDTGGQAIVTMDSSTTTTNVVATRPNPLKPEDDLRRAVVHGAL